MTQIYKRPVGIDEWEPPDPCGNRYHRHVLDWLREPTDDGEVHVYHTTEYNDCAYEAWSLFIDEFGDEERYWPSVKLMLAYPSGACLPTF